MAKEKKKDNKLLICERIFINLFKNNIIYQCDGVEIDGITLYQLLYIELNIILTILFGKCNTRAWVVPTFTIYF